MNNDRINILYIDDELQNLQSFKASFRREYNIDITTSISEAESILDGKEIHIIFADQRMPKKTGVEFFESIRAKHPDPVRILVTGYTDITSAIDAINKGEVFRFIAKPWDEKYVTNAISAGYEIYRNRVDLRIRNQELSKAYEELDKFVYSASHDLRAPLMSILGVVQLAMIEEEPSKQKEYLGLIKHSVHKLDAFIINIIDYYKNARGNSVVTEIDFGTLLKESMDSVRYLPEFGELEVEADVKQPGIFYSDILKIRIILINILTNAIKFQDKQKTKQELKITADVTEENATLIIKDNGIGIKETDINNIFNMFYRGRAGNSGSGIGLYIVKEALGKLGGSISVESIFGEGTSFVIQIPNANPEN